MSIGIKLLHICFYNILCQQKLNKQAESKGEKTPKRCRENWTSF